MKTTTTKTLAAIATLLALGAGRGAAAADAPKYEMATTTLALLAKAPGAKPLGEREIQSIQERHLAYLRQLLDERKALLEGPIHGKAPMTSVIVLDVPTVEEARAILDKDPWIASGQLAAEIHPWFSAKSLLRPPAPSGRSTLCYLGLLRRPPDAPTYPKEKLEEIQAGHMANIQAMADSHDLAIAGPMTDDTPLRGIFIFRTTDPERIKSLVERDPAVRAGRLGLDLYPWYVPEGTLPD
jgi:uncharacterized protein YciI